MAQSRKLHLVAAACTMLGCSTNANDTSGRERGFGAGTAAPAPAGMIAPADSNGRDGYTNPPHPVLPPVQTAGSGASATSTVMMKDECAAVSQTAEVRVQPADIIIGIDSSGSMAEEIAFLQQHLNAFSQQITDSGVDVHVILVAAEQSAMTTPVFFGDGGGVCVPAPLGSGTCPDDSKPPRYIHVKQEVGSNDVLGIFISAYPHYRQHLRENSLKTFVSVTDADATDPPINSADSFISAVEALEPQNASFWSNYRYSSIYCFTWCLEAAGVGSVHAELVRKTKGVSGDLCQQNFKPVFDALAQQVLEGTKLACDWDIPTAPTGETFDAGKTNVRLTIEGAPMPIAKVAHASECVDREAWHYDDERAPTRVVACPASCTRIQAAKRASIDILFGCETVLAPRPD